MTPQTAVTARARGGRAPRELNQRARRYSNDTRLAATLSPVPVLDRLGRPLRDLRISVTDRCNFRCVYCMPKEVFGRDYQFLAASELLDFEEITRLARAFVANGVEQDPPHRRRAARAPRRRAPDRDARGARRRPDADDERLAAAAEGAGARGRGPHARHREPRLARRRDLPGDERRRLPGRARARRDRRGAAAVGLPVKVNAVVKRGVNERRDRRAWRATSAAPAHILRFIEYMDVGAHERLAHGRRRAGRARSSRRSTRSSRSSRSTPLYRGEVAKRWRYDDGAGEIGVIASVTQPFCGDCTRARLSAEGQALHVPLRGARPRPARARARAARPTTELAAAIADDLEPAAATATRSCAPRTPSTCPKVEMSYIGG